MRRVGPVNFREPLGQQRESEHLQEANRHASITCTLPHKKSNYAKIKEAIEADN
jgi:hypothetical protein